MKRLKLLLLLPLLILTGCEDTPKDNDGNVMTSEFGPNFSLVCRHYSTNYLRDTDTDIMYVYYSGHYRASISAYYNAEGKPMTYSEFKEVHTAKYH